MSKVIVKDDHVFIISDDPELLAWGGNNSAFVINKECYRYVKKFVDKNKEMLDALMISESPGTVLYWEENYHDIFANILIKQSGFPRLQISNALCSLGF